MENMIKRLHFHKGVLHAKSSSKYKVVLVILSWCVNVILEPFVNFAIAITRQIILW